MLNPLRLNRMLFGLYLITVIGVTAAALFVPSWRAVSYAPLREIILPPPKPIEVSVLYSTEKEAWLTDVIARFEATNPRVEGHPIDLQIKKMGSREIYLAVLDGSEKPAIVSPASSLQISILEDLSASRFGAPIVTANDSTRCRSALKTPLVIVAWKDRAQALWGSDPGPDLWEKLDDALTDPKGWEGYGHADWGYVKFGHTNPLKSNSGFQTILLLTYDYHHKTSGLTANDILGDSEYQKWFTAFEGTISQFGESTGTYMQDIVAYGPSTYDMVAVYEATAIEQAANAANRYGELEVFYPPATHMSDHPFCIINAEWVSPQQAEAARLFINYLTSHDAQQIALMQYGFRPVDPSVAINQTGSPFAAQKVSGLKVDLPPEVELPPGNVLNTLLDFWTRNVAR